MAEPESPFQHLAVRARSLAARQVFETGIPLRDGIELAGDVYLPHGGDSRAPAIVEITPYGKDDGLFVVPEAEHYQRNGYAFVAVDTRGRGKSEGEWSAMAHDPHDTYDVIEWVAAQDWCDGNVGTTGLSYMGWVQWAGASQRPPHLRCMISTSAAGRWQQEIPYTNGVLQLYFAWWVYMVRRRIQESAGMAHTDWDKILSTLPIDAIGDYIAPSGPSWANLVHRDELDGFWSALRFDGRYDQIDLPCLHVTGWYDLEDLLGAFHHYEHMAAASPARDQQYLVVGPWSHVKSRYPDNRYGDADFGPDAALDMDALHLRWFDHWLKGRDNGIASEARVKIFEPGTNAWRQASRWPLSDDQLILYLHAGPAGETGGRLAGEAPADGQPSATFTYDPLDPVPTGLDVRRYPLEDVPLDQTHNEARADVLTYTTGELTGPVTLSGWAWLELYAASDCDDTDWHVKVTDVAPDGRSDKVTQGCLRASYRDGLSDPAPLEPGLPYRFRIELWPSHHCFQPGHRIRLSITSSDFPWFARNLNRFGPIACQDNPRVARNTVCHSAGLPSRLVLPVERGCDEPAAPSPFEGS